MRLYLCGPMTGIKQYNFPKFVEEANRLRYAGYQVVSPAELAMASGFNPIKNPDIVCSDDMRRVFLEDDKRIMLTCDGVALMYGWQNSEGCCEETDTFREKDPLKPINYVSFFLKRSDTFTKMGWMHEELKSENNSKA